MVWILKLRSNKLLICTFVADIFWATYVHRKIEKKSIFWYNIFSQHLGSVRHNNYVCSTPLYYCLQLFICGSFAENFDMVYKECILAKWIKGYLFYMLLDFDRKYNAIFDRVTNCISIDSVRHHVSVLSCTKF